MKKLISAFFLVVLSASAVAGHHAKDGHELSTPLQATTCSLHLC